MPRTTALTLVLIACAASCVLANDTTKNDKPEILSVLRIWDVAPHSAFTDLVRHKGTWFCAFREDKSHWGPGAAGKIRVIRSADGKKWESAALISGDGDLRDPKLSITPDGKEFKRLADAGYGGESTIRFAKDGTAWCLQRGKNNQAYLGKSMPPYDAWTWLNCATPSA